MAVYILKIRKKNYNILFKTIKKTNKEMLTLSIIENMQPNDKVLYSDRVFSKDFDQKLFLRRSIDDGSNRPKYYLNVLTNINGKLVQQGYLYFYLDYEKKTSDFIGIKVNEEYRNLNIGSFLIATWIDLCFNNGYNFLGTSEKQRKPFLLYMLKTYGFEILDRSLYDKRPDVITICRSIDLLDRKKYLLFRDPKHESNFKQTNIYSHDNYETVHNTDGMILLDNVVLPLQSRRRNLAPYSLLDAIKAEEKSKITISNHKK